MRENRPYGSEGGEGNSFPTPIKIEEPSAKALPPLFRRALQGSRPLPRQDLPPLGARLGLLLAAGDAFAAHRLDEAVEIAAAVIVGDLLVRLDVLDRPDLDHMLDEIGLGVRAAGMVDVARHVSPAGAVDGPARIDLEQVFVVELVGRIGVDLAAAGARDELSLFDRCPGEHAEPGQRSTDAGARRP